MHLVHVTRSMIFSRRTAATARRRIGTLLAAFKYPLARSSGRYTNSTGTGESSLRTRCRLNGDGPYEIGFGTDRFVAWYHIGRHWGHFGYHLRQNGHENGVLAGLSQDDARKICQRLCASGREVFAAPRLDPVVASRATGKNGFATCAARPLESDACPHPGKTMTFRC